MERDVRHVSLDSQRSYGRYARRMRACAIKECVMSNFNLLGIALFLLISAFTEFSAQEATLGVRLRETHR